MQTLAFRHTSEFKCATTLIVSVRLIFRHVSGSLGFKIVPESDSGAQTQSAVYSVDAWLPFSQYVRVVARSAPISHVPLYNRRGSTLRVRLNPNSNSVFSADLARFQAFTRPEESRPNLLRQASGSTPSWCIQG